MYNPLMILPAMVDPLMTDPLMMSDPPSLQLQTPAHQLLLNQMMNL
jgi:hypothetical protein